ncbi:MAG: hypothetical protein ABEJ22_02050 [Haloferacaceae archaeon]
MSALQSLRPTDPLQTLRTVVVGSDPAARREHLRVAAALAVAVGAGAALVRLRGVGVSPVVWDGFYALSVASLAGLTAANAYWRGGLLAGFALVFAPVGVGLFVAYVGSGAFASPLRTLGFGVALVSVVSLVFLTVGSVLGLAVRWVRHRTGAGA